MNWKNRAYCKECNLKNQGKKVHMYGWIDTIRDHGNLLFMHLRDITGIAQLVFDPKKNHEAYALSQTIRPEFVVEIEGIITERSAEAKNSNMPTGDIEIVIEKLTILNSAETPPFVISEKESLKEGEESTPANIDEDLRLKYRYLDLRRPSLQKNLLNRYQITKTIRNYMDTKNFTEIETPFLTKSTPEGARDYLVPSRIHPNHFYALPQSPQLFKQLLMVAGFDKYFQIVKCFRDEDLRPNRQPEFTQFDMEASFIDEEFIYETIEGLMTNLFSLAEHIKLKAPFERITYDHALNFYGSDAPDLRYDLKFADVTETLKNCGYNIFKTIADEGGSIKGFNLKGKADELSKNYLQSELAGKVIQKLGGKGLTWMKMLNGQLESNIAQFFNEEEKAELIKLTKAENGDVLFFTADKSPKKNNEVLGRFRKYIAEKHNLIDKNLYKICWVTHFPLFEEQAGTLTSVHHPFTSPSEDISHITDKNELLKIKSRSYDLVFNGEEIGGGSIRMHNQKIQKHIFEILGFTREDIEEKFGFFVSALKYGTPPHGGIALGIDRLTSVIFKTDSIRDVIAFPKNRMAWCPLTKAPSVVHQKQLDELHLTCKKKLD